MKDINIKKIRLKIIYSYLISIAVGFALVGLTLWFSENTEIMGWVNSLFFAGLLIFAFGWMMLVSNANLFFVVTYGLKQFMSGLLGKKVEKDIIEYRDSGRKVPKYVIINLFVVGFLFMLTSLILFYGFGN